ncbi:MAG: prephenate dehydratase [Proteobacteria bacterium]|nr:prephenate dehydratase [Pseudomonadota bacterium]MDA0926920.1 prephenate dehydratase [Pseudomonadota bacterium]
MNAKSTVAYLGPAGTFTQAAALNHFGESVELKSCVTIGDVFARVESGEVDYGVVPVENSTEGIVNNTQDCLIDSKVKISGEEVIPIHHHLLVDAASPDMAVKRIASHQQSLAQCRGWLHRHHPNVELVECSSNAEAAASVNAESGTAAIAGDLAAATYKLHIRERRIQDQDHNSTRFLILGSNPVPATGRDKTSVLIYTANKPGALFHVLEPFENLQISLTKIDSRPSKRQAWEYVFFIDFEGHEDDTLVQELFARLADRTEEIKVLGSYPAFAK